MKKIIVLLIFEMLLFSCSSTTQYVEYQSPKQNIEDGRAMVCIIRPKTPIAASIKTKIYQDDIFIGRLGYANHLCWKTEPKQSDIIGKTESKEILNLKLESNKEYFIRLDYNMGFIVGRPKFIEIEKNEFMQKLSKVNRPPVVK